MLEETRDFRPLTEHLSEIRLRLFRVLGVFLILMAVAWNYDERIFDFLLSPIYRSAENIGLRFVIVDVTERFWITFKIATIGAFSLGLPLYLYEFYAFIKPALKKSEKSIVRTALLFSPFLFLVGALLWLEWLLPKTLTVLLKMGPQNNVQDLLSLGSFLSFVIWMTVLFGGLFQLPLILLSLVKVGVLSSSFLRKFRKEAFLCLAVISAVATPSPDAFTMLVLWAPLVFLYEGVIWISKIIERKNVAIDMSAGQSV